jgi:protein TonB
MRRSLIVALSLLPSIAVADDPPPQNVAPQALEGQRVAGDKNIVPDDVTKVEISRAGKEKIVGSFKLCIDTDGKPSAVKQLKSTGFSKYDEKIVAGIKTWRYKPYEVNGKAAAVCTAVTFIYSQPLPPPPKK